MKRSGFSGVFDFRGLLIRLAQRAGFIYEYDWQISKNPQSQAIRTRSRSLQFTGLESDRARSRGAMPDFLLVFSVPGDNAVPVDSPREVSRNDWIDWAESCWSWHEIRDTDTLNTAEAKGPEDVRHICPLQLAVIGRLIRLYSNPGEIIFSPFAGIGSEGYMALKLGRRFVGCEIKDEYVQAALKNLERAKRLREESEKTLFDLIPAVAESEAS
jgi:DNA modification methylase